MTGLTRNVVRDMQKILTRQKMQLQALADGEEIPDDRQDVMDLPHLFKPTSAGLHDAARTLGTNPLPEEEPGIPVPGVFGPVDRAPTQEELDAGLARNPTPHRVRGFGAFIEHPDIVEERERGEADAKDRKEERPARRTRAQDRRTHKQQPKSEAKTATGKGKDVTEQDKQNEAIDAQLGQQPKQSEEVERLQQKEQERRVKEAEEDKTRLEEQTKREQEQSRQANPSQQTQGGQQSQTTTTQSEKTTTTQKGEPKKGQGR